jgi:hypothetical protein
MSRNADNDQIEKQQGDQNDAVPHVNQQQVGNVDNQHSAGVNTEVTSHQHPGDSLVFTDNHKDSFVFNEEATASNQQQIENFDDHHSAGENNQVIDSHNVPSPVFHDDFLQVTDQLHPASNPMHHDFFF